MRYFECNKEILSLDRLREELIIETASNAGDVLSVDIYGVPPSHPDNHLGYWNFKLPQKEIRINMQLDFNEISFNSVKPNYKYKDRTLFCPYEDSWINPEFRFGKFLNLSIVLWKENNIVEAKPFEILLNNASQQKLQLSLGHLKRLDESSIYFNHFCKEKIPLPQLLVIESTSRCNLKCPMCPRSMDKSPSGEFADLDESVLIKLENAIANCNSVCLSWMGEPLVNQRLDKIIQRIKAINNKVLVTMTTNGMLLDESWAERLIDSGVDAISFSIDSNDDAIYEKIRVGGNLKRVKDNIRTLNKIKKSKLSLKPAINIAYVGGEENIDQIPNIIQMADELGIKTVSLAPIDDFTLTAEYENKIGFSEDTKKRGREAFYKAESMAGTKGIKISYEMPIQFFNFLDIKKEEYTVDKELFNNDVSNEEIKRNGLQKGCYVPWMHSFIAHNGDVHPCCISSRVLGNLKENTFEEIWYGDKYSEFRNRLKSYNPNEECRRCRRVVWNKSEFVESLKDWMEVGRHEIHGLGWNAIEKDDLNKKYRVICKKATLFLRNSHKPYLSIQMGSESFRIAQVRIYANDKEVGLIYVSGGCKTVYFKLQDDASDIFKIDILLESSDMKLKVYSVRLLVRNEVPFIHRLITSMRKISVVHYLSKLSAYISYTKYFILSLKRKIL